MQISYLTDSVSNSVSETVCHGSDDAKLIDKLKSQINIVDFVAQQCLHNQMY